MAQRLPGENERGFTILEVLVAIVLLLVGVLGVVQMIDTANAVTDNTKAREGAVALSRQILEDARTINYADLNTSGAPSQLEQDLQSVIGPDSNASLSGWQLSRRNIDYTITLFACVFDDGQDGVRQNDSAATYCPGSAANRDSGNTAPLDLNPDDFRRVEVSITWDFGPQTPDCRAQGGGTVTGGSSCIQQSELIANPTGGLGPGIKDIAPVYTGVTVDPNNNNAAVNNDSVNAAIGIDKGAVEQGTSMGFNVTTSSPASSVGWTADDGVSGGAAKQTDSAGVQWQFTWIYPTTPKPPLNDGPHTVTVQAFLAGLSGRPKTFPQLFNRFVPAAVTTPPNAIGVDSRVTPIVELNWNQHGDNDIKGYAAFQQTQTNQQLDDSNPPPGGTTDRVACPLNQDVNQLTCFDSNPPASGTAKYYVAAFDRPWSSVIPPMANPTVYAPDCTALVNCWQCPTITAAANINLTAPAFATRRVGCPSATLSVDITAGIANPGPTWTANNGTDPICFNTPPNPAGPELNWSNLTANDTDGILFYRVYRDPADLTNPAYSSRYAVSTAEDFVDQQANGVSHTYAVTAVDSNYQESPASPINQVLNHC